MVRPLKDAGLREVAALRRRARRAVALGRVLPPDAAYIVERCDEIESRITAMLEYDENGSEV